MRKRITWIIIIIVFLAAGATVCALRWKAWFSKPPEPVWNEAEVDYRFITFGQDSLPHFVNHGTVWSDTQDPKHLRILLLGDVHNEITHDRYLSLGATYPDLDAYAQLGDWLDRGYHYYAQQLQSDLKGTAFEYLPVLNTPGNHEYKKGLGKTLSPVWLSLFQHPQNGPANGLGSTYYVDFDNLRFIVLDTSAPRLLHHFTRLNKWLKQTLNTSGNKYTVVIMHHPVYSHAKGRWNVNLFTFLARPLRKADLVFSGHNHLYARRLPFVEIGSVHKSHTMRKHVKADKTSQQPVYELLTITRDSLLMQTYLLDSDSLYDEVVILP